MLFSVIYSVDVPEGINIESYLPRDMSLYDVTEDYSGDEYKDAYDTYSYLEGDWERGTHKKLCALLSREEFEQFLAETGLICDSTETMGSLGAPGFGVGWAPAIAFTSNDYYAIQSAYVTPGPEVTQKSGKSDRPENFDRIKEVMLGLWG